MSHREICPECNKPRRDYTSELTDAFSQLCNTGLGEHPPYSAIVGMFAARQLAILADEVTLLVKHTDRIASSLERTEMVAVALERIADKFAPTAEQIKKAREESDNAMPF